MNKIFTFFLFAILGNVCCVKNATAQNKEKDTVYKFGHFLIHADDTMKIDFIVKMKPLIHKKSKGDTLYEDSKYLILGNSDKLDAFGVFKQYKVPHKFSSFRVSVYKGKLVPPDFKTDPAALLFRTQIRYQCKSKGVNFAGHYTIAEWGCGSECELIAVIDRINGKINYSNVIEATDDNFYGLKYKADSKMIIMNDWLLSDYKGYIFCSDISKLKIAAWNNSKFRFLVE